MHDRLLTDRVKLVVDLAFYQTNVSPHGVTERCSLTVPSDRIAYIPYLFMLARRRAEASANPMVYMSASYQPNGGTLRPIAELYLFGNEISDWESLAIPINLWMFPGDFISIGTYDGSTGGAVDYTIRAPVYEIY